jgi:hypothetical protein
MNATSSAVSALTASSLSLGGTATSLVKGNGTTLSGTSAQFVKGDASLDSAIYGSRKFTQITSVTLDGVQSSASIFGTVSPALNFIAANEAQIGDIYTLTINGTLTVPSVSFLTRWIFVLWGFGGTLTNANIPIVPTGSTYNMVVTFTVRSSTTAYMTISGNIANNGTIVGAFGMNYSLSSVVISNATTLSASYTATNSANLMTVNTVTFTKS